MTTPSSPNLLPDPLAASGRTLLPRRGHGPSFATPGPPPPFLARASRGQVPAPPPAASGITDRAARPPTNSVATEHSSLEQSELEEELPKSRDVLFVSRRWALSDKNWSNCTYYNTFEYTYFLR